MGQKHHFKIGQSFLIEKPKNTETYLQVARDTEKYIATKKIETEDGMRLCVSRPNRMIFSKDILRRQSFTGDSVLQSNW